MAFKKNSCVYTVNSSIAKASMLADFIFEKYIESSPSGYGTVETDKKVNI